MRTLVMAVVVSLFISTPCLAGPLKVGASIFPVYDFLCQIMDPASVQLILPPGTDPHHYELGPRDIIRLQELDLIFYVGFGMEYWLESSLKLIDPVRVVCLGEGLAEKKGNEVDYHLWLDPLIAKEMVKRIGQALSSADPANGTRYQQAVDRYVQELERLHQEYVQALKPWQGQAFLVSHGAFGYLARRYGLVQLAVMGVSAEEQPSAKRLAEIVTEARRLRCKAVFYEPWGERKTVELLAQELGVTPLELHPLGTVMPSELGKRTYLSIMRDNLTNLLKGFSGGK
ncbi:MAG TPA: zinc ABC transporter substrate-binding protein [Firmicutes bacterium]|nr:zinc ABC transporter substrate-binding protein [Bacillota bacterium]